MQLRTNYAANRIINAISHNIRQSDVLATGTSNKEQRTRQKAEKQRIHREFIEPSAKSRCELLTSTCCKNRGELGCFWVL